jgi:hypothetical protein
MPGNIDNGREVGTHDILGIVVVFANGGGCTSDRTTSGAVLQLFFDIKSDCTDSAITTDNWHLINVSLVIDISSDVK